MSSFVTGEVVDITIKGARVQADDLDDVGFRTITVTHGEINNSLHVQQGDDVTIERVAPAEWPPRPGDLWRDREGELWFAAQHWPDYDDVKDCRGMNGTGWRPVLVPVHLGEQGSPARPEDVIQPCGPFTLVHREPAQDGT